MLFAGVVVGEVRVSRRPLGGSCRSRGCRGGCGSSCRGRSSGRGGCSGRCCGGR